MAGVKRQYMGCAGRVANGINTVHLSYVRERTGHALVGARQWIPAEDIKDPVKSLVTGSASGPAVPDEGPAGHDLLEDAYADGLSRRHRLRRRGSTAAALNCASTWRAPARPTSCGWRLPSPLPRPRHHGDLHGGREEAADGQESAGRSAPRARAPRASAGMPGPGSPPRRRPTASSSAVTWSPASWPSTTATSPEGQPCPQAPPDQGRRAEMAGGGGFRVRQGLLRPGPVPGQALHRDPAPPRPGHGRPRDLRRHRRPAQGPHRHPGTAARPARPRRPPTLA